MSTGRSSTGQREATRGRADVGNGELYYEVAGDGGEVIVLIHGNAGDLRHWDRQVGALAEEHQVIRYDVRGFGRSPVPVDGRTYANYDDLAALLDALGVEAAHIVGWSMGSAIAVDFVLSHPSRARSLVTVSPWMFGYMSESAQVFFNDLQGVVVTAIERGSKAAAEAWMKMPFFTETVRDPEAGKAFEQIAAECSWAALTHPDQHKGLEPAAFGRRHELTLPTLIVAAEHDIPPCREMAALLDAELVNAKLVELTGTGHLLQFEKPDEFNEHVLRFVDGVSRGEWDR